MRRQFVRHTLILSLTLIIKSQAAVAQPASPDSPISESMISEIHQLRQDLKNTAATVQRVQIAIYRLQAQTAAVDRATQLLDQARSQCKQQEAQRKIVATQIEQAEARKQGSQNPSDQQAIEEMLSYHKSAAATQAAEGQQCQAQEIDAETRFQTEQAKMNELQEQLDHLDRDLAERSRK
jgi:hypothetical protein